jgi:arabinose-5-phosphate isomerase
MAISLNPLDALHGDLGLVARDDVTLLFSNGDKKSAVRTIFAQLSLRGSRWIALVGSVEFNLARVCDGVCSIAANQAILNLCPPIYGLLPPCPSGNSSPALPSSVVST